MWQWLEWGILPPQNLLIDAPHLVGALPSLVVERAKDLETWNRIASFASFENLPLDHDKIAPFRFTQADWVSRPVWFWPRLKEHPAIDDVTDPWSSEWPDHVFCEDTSRFVVEEKAREFTSAMSSQFARRHVEFLPNVDYGNKSRFAL